MTPKELVIQILDESGLNNGEIARHLGLHEFEIRRIRNIDVRTKYERLAMIADMFGYELIVTMRKKDP